VLFNSNPVAMPHALARHNVFAATQHHRAQTGMCSKSLAMPFCAAFQNAEDAVRAALDAQRALWAERGVKWVRCGYAWDCYTGEIQVQAETYVSSLTLVRVAANHVGGTRRANFWRRGPRADLVRAELPGGVTLRELGAYKLRGVTQPETIYQLVAADLPAEFPPLRVAEPGTADATSVLDHLVRAVWSGGAANLNNWRSIGRRRSKRAGIWRSCRVNLGGQNAPRARLAGARAKEGAVVLHGGCYEYEATTPYLPFVEALREWVHWASAEQLRAQLGASASEIAKFAPEIESKLGALPPDPPLAPNEERLRLFDHVARLLQTLARRAGLLFFIDDLHWAGPGDARAAALFTAAPA